MSLPATDNFNRTDANPIGGNWTTITGFEAGQISSNRYAPNQGGSYEGGSFWNADVFAKDQYSQAKAATIYTYSRVAVRIASGAKTLYFWGYYNPANVQKMEKVVAGVFTQIGSDYSISLNTNDLLKLRIEGTTLTPSVNGVDQTTQTDSAIESGSPGLTAYYASRWDDWEGGNVAAGGIYADSWHPEVSKPFLEKREVIPY
jgi:hypothetical protein